MAEHPHESVWWYGDFDDVVVVDSVVVDNVKVGVEASLSLSMEVMNQFYAAHHYLTSNELVLNLKKVMVKMVSLFCIFLVRLPPSVNEPLIAAKHISFVWTSIESYHRLLQDQLPY
jgi:hypothetical protein